jgi:signal transduction histidine kinase
MGWGKIGTNGDRFLPFVLSGAGILEVLLVHPDYDRRLFVPLALLLPLTLLFRRRQAVAVLAVNVAAWVVIDVNSPINEDPLALAITLAIAVYSVGAHTAGRQTVAGAALVAALCVLGTAADANEGTFVDYLGNAIFFFVIFGGLWLAGRAMRRRRARERELIVEREERARAAVAEERTRIARELHDVVAHAISVIVLQARGARHSLADDPDDARHAIDAIERTASQALGEMRRLLAILRADDDAASLAPGASLAHLDVLADEVRAAGLPVEIRVAGEPRELSPGLDASAYRIVQEALTNALKHAVRARAVVTVDYGEELLDIEVADDGTGLGSGSNGGHGLTGMRERAAVFGGRIDAGPRNGGGYAVRARLPL